VELTQRPAAELLALLASGDVTSEALTSQYLAVIKRRDPSVRQRGLESGKAIVIGKNVWIGGGAILLPGITIGDDAIIGAGSVVTRDVAPGTTVAGNPARPVQSKQDSPDPKM